MKTEVILSDNARFRITGVRITEVLLYLINTHTDRNDYSNPLAHARRGLTTNNTWVKLKDHYHRDTEQQVK